MNSQKFLSIALFAVGVVFAAPNPHIGMVNNNNVRDVGAVYSRPGYASQPAFLLMDKNKPACYSRYANPSILT
jgi:hypothetical protein